MINEKIDGLELTIGTSGFRDILRTADEFHGWPIYYDDDFDDDGPKGYWFYVTVTGNKGQVRDIGIRISEETLVMMLSAIKERFDGEYLLPQKFTGFPPIVEEKLPKLGCSCEGCTCDAVPLKDRNLESFEETLWGP